MEFKLTDLCVSENCKNITESYNIICVKCNKCGRFNLDKLEETE